MSFLCVRYDKAEEQTSQNKFACNFEEHRLVSRRFFADVATPIRVIAVSSKARR
ncbi:hypothetical protein C8035_v004234 [Colletotrichum spinosum]|uniref:Uncharacterized protein n=1 Tax=Colletotrichum spinosum TaxID=1347390 RepID=A0A4V3HR00_9PEZI|nr:hypothetical protein C8035_v004234 [Colletotrichum spinosum]